MIQSLKFSSSSHILSAHWPNKTSSYHIENTDLEHFQHSKQIYWMVELFLVCLSCTLQHILALSAFFFFLIFKDFIYIGSGHLRRLVQSLSHFWLCDPTDCSMPGFPILHFLPEFVQAHVHWVKDAIQPSYPLSPSSLALNLSQHQGLFQLVGSSHQVAEVLKLQRQSMQWIFRVDFL